MKVKPVLAEFKKSDGTHRINIYLYSKGKKTFIPTEYYVRESDFDEGTVKKSHRNHLELNGVIRALCSDIESLGLRFGEKDPFKLKDLYLKPEVTAISIPDFIKRFAEDMEKGRALNKGKPFAPASITSFKSYARHITNFIGDRRIGWQDVNEQFYNEYCTYLRYELGFMENTIARAIKVLKKMMRVAMRSPYKLHSNTDFMEFHAAYVDTDSIFLNEDEIKAFSSAEVDKHLVEDQDRFCISYNLFLRFGDGVNIDERDIFQNNGKHFVKLMQAKTRHKPVIPLFPETLERLKKYKYKLPESTNQESNWKLKEIGKIAGINSIFTETYVKQGKIEKESGFKYLFITTHTARRSMATNYYLSMRKHGNIDLKSLQLMGGWKSIAMLEKYLKIESLENALDASEHPFFN
jgi:site-specific recombinase XerD